MVANTYSLKIDIEAELKLFLETKSIQQLQSITRKQCRNYLEQKWNKSLSKQKQEIKSYLVKYIRDFIKSNPECSPKTKNKSHKRSFDESYSLQQQQPPFKKRKSSLSLNEKPIECIKEIEEMTQLIQAENVIYKLNDTLNHKLINKNKINIDYDNIEYEALKNKLTKTETELKKTKESLKEYALILQPKIIQTQKLRKENEILNKNIEILKCKYEEEIKSLKIRLKNETETVKDERFKLLRKDKYIQRINEKYNFVCNKYNIDRDNVVIQMKAAKHINNNNCNKTT